MYKFSVSSAEKLQTAHPVLQVLFTAVLLKRDITIIQGHRGRKEQEEAFHSGHSKVRFPHSKHDASPSFAVDVAPYINSSVVMREKECSELAGVILSTAQELDIPIRWGADWDSDNDIEEHTFQDFMHFELDTSRYRNTVWFQLYGI